MLGGTGGRPRPASRLWHIEFRWDLAERPRTEGSHSCIVMVAIPQRLEYLYIDSWITIESFVVNTTADHARRTYRGDFWKLIRASVYLRNGGTGISRS